MPANDKTIQRVLRYVFGETNPEESAHVEQGMAADAEQAALVGDLTRLREAAPDAAPRGRYDVERARHVLAQRRRQPTAREKVSRRITGHGIRWATVAVLVVTGMSMFWTRDRWRSRPYEPAAHVYTTAPGGRQTVNLPDGTMVTLGPDSRLVVSDGYGRATREVTLEGEGYFRVRHDVAHPFAVRTAWGVARDVGTAYAVRAYGDEHAMHVAVAEGRVEIAPPDSPVGAGPVIGRGTAAAVEFSGRVVVQPNADVARALLWLQGGLAFDDAPLPNVLRELERTFNLKITVADTSLVHEALTAAFGNEPVDNVLDAVTQSIGATYQRTGRVVTIRRRSTTSRHSAPSTPRLPVLTARGTE